VPTYSYECTECGNRFDIVQAFTDDALTTCEQCSGRLRKRFNSVGIVFKGSGFYRTDSRESGKTKTNGSKESTGSSTNGSSDSSGSSAEKSGSGSGSAEKATSANSTPSPAATSS
jgi:putative FmdB family regulatory protein